MSSARAFAKINLALVVGPRRTDDRHELVTVLERIDLHDDITLGPADLLTVEGFPEDTIVRSALEAFARTVGVEPLWRVHIEKRIPVAAGLGGGSADAAAALELANTTLDEPCSHAELHRIAAAIGSDVPFFLSAGAQLATGDGTELQPLELPRDYHVLLVLPDGEAKQSTGSVYDAFDARDGATGFTARAAALRRAIEPVHTGSDLAHAPLNDLASSPIASELVAAGAFRADVSGAGPTVYGLFEHRDAAVRAAEAFATVGWTLATRPVAADDLPGVAR